LTDEEYELSGQQALKDHVLERARFALRKWGPNIDYDKTLLLLQDRDVVRYETELAFDGAPLHPGEFGYAEPLGEDPEQGFRLCLHPCFENRPQDLPLLILYHIVRINYGDIATDEEAELFGSTLLELEPEAYYQSLCRLADSMPGAPG
jgi:hypothetical protein